MGFKYAKKTTLAQSSIFKKKKKKNTNQKKPDILLSNCFLVIKLFPILHLVIKILSIILKDELQKEVREWYSF